ncbi:hypothetical protein V6N12_034789 [Hibiscus sabdariffa]|uniref:Uncharacterized protein n=1 Tax=Hibiscus sabdariffa TaxID=183260 RepID=A0ABR2B8S0_9ROSI
MSATIFSGFNACSFSPRGGDGILKILFLEFLPLLIQEMPSRYELILPLSLSKERNQGFSKHSQTPSSTLWKNKMKFLNVMRKLVYKLTT